MLKEQELKVLLLIKTTEDKLAHLPQRRLNDADTLTTIATGLKTAINASASLQAIGVSATSAGTTVTIKSTSANATTYSQSTGTGATETITLLVNQNAILTAGLGGTKTTGDVITLTVYDSALTGGSTLMMDY